MRSIRRAWRRLSGSLWCGRQDRELDEEVEAHIGMLTEANLRAGMSPQEARRAAVLKFGGVEVTKENYRDQRGLPWIETTWTDLRYAARMLHRSKGFTAVAVLSLAIGIGGNTAIFSLVDRVLVRSLPVEDAERLVILGVSSSSGIRTAFTYPDFADYRAQNEVFDGLVCYTPRPVTLNHAGKAERLQGMIVSGNYFTTLRVQLALGRPFLHEEDRTRGTHPVVVLGYGSWQRRFGGDTSVVGKQVNLNGYSFTVVGIAPPEFNGTIAGIAPDIYLPVMMQGQISPGWRIDPLFGPRSRGLAWLEVMGRLKPGISREQAAAAMTVLGSRVARANPNQDGTARPEPKFILSDGRMGQTRLLQDLRLPLQLLMATVGLILLIACSNIANLLLARASTRQREIAVRIASGAGRMRLVRQLLTESLLLSGLGGTAGLALARVLSGLLAGFAPPDDFRQVTLDSRLDLRVLGFAVGLSLLTGIVFGLAPALIASRPDLVPALKDEMALPGKRRRRLNLRNVLVMAQVALSLVVLVGAGLCIRSLRNLQSIDTGFETSKVLTMSVDVGLSGYSNDRGMQFYSQLADRVRALRGVEAVSVAALVPLSGGFGMNFVGKIEGYTPKPGDNPTFDYNIVGPDYFRTLKVPVMQGREFNALDTAVGPKVAIVNEAAARIFWPGQNPVGRRLADLRAFFDTDSKQIVGVVKDSKYRDLKEETRPAIYVPLAQDYRSGMALYVRIAGEPSAMLTIVRGEVQAMDASLPVYGIRTLEEQKSGSLYNSRMAAGLLTIFGLLALLLAAVGLSGVMAFTVNRRRREIGIRMALGAQGGDVRRLVMLEGMAIVVAGLVLGLAVALTLTRLVRSFLFGVTPTDPVTFAVAAAMLATVAMLASYLPARKASQIDPMTAIRC